MEPSESKNCPQGGVNIEFKSLNHNPSLTSNSTSSHNSLQRLRRFVSSYVRLVPSDRRVGAASAETLDANAMDDVDDDDDDDDDDDGGDDLLGAPFFPPTSSFMSSPIVARVGVANRRRIRRPMSPRASATRGVARRANVQSIARARRRRRRGGAERARGATSDVRSTSLARRRRVRRVRRRGKCANARLAESGPRTRR